MVKRNAAMMSFGNVIVDKIEINCAKSIAETFDEFVVNAGPNITTKIP